MHIRRSGDGEDRSEEDLALHHKFYFHPRISSHLHGQPRGRRIHWEVSRGLDGDPVLDIISLNISTFYSRSFNSD